MYCQYVPEMTSGVFPALTWTLSVFSDIIILCWYLVGCTALVGFFLFPLRRMIYTNVLYACKSIYLNVLTWSQQTNFNHGDFAIAITGRIRYTNFVLLIITFCTPTPCNRFFQLSVMYQRTTIHSLVYDATLENFVIVIPN